MTTTEAVLVHFKWYDGCRYVRRFSIDFRKDRITDNYTMLLERLAQVGYSSDLTSLWWIDSEGDHVLLNDAEALEEAFQLNKGKKLIKLISYNLQDTLWEIDRQCEQGSHYVFNHEKVQVSKSRSRSRSRSRSCSLNRHFRRHIESSSECNNSSDGRNDKSSGKSSCSSPVCSDFSVIRKHSKMGEKWKSHKMSQQFQEKQENDDNLKQVWWHFQDLQKLTSLEPQKQREFHDKPISQSIQSQPQHHQASLPPPLQYPPPTISSIPNYGSNFGTHSMSPYHGGSRFSSYNMRSLPWQARYYLSQPPYIFESRCGNFWPPYSYLDFQLGHGALLQSYYNNCSSPTPLGLYRMDNNSHKSSSKKLRNLEKKLEKLSVSTDEQQQQQ